MTVPLPQPPTFWADRCEPPFPVFPSTWVRTQSTFLKVHRRTRAGKDALHLNPSRCFPTVRKHSKLKPRLTEETSLLQLKTPLGLKQTMDFGVLSTCSWGQGLVLSRAATQEWSVVCNSVDRAESAFPGLLLTHTPEGPTPVTKKGEPGTERMRVQSREEDKVLGAFMRTGTLDFGVFSEVYGLVMKDDGGWENKQGSPGRVCVVHCFFL